MVVKRSAFTTGDIVIESVVVSDVSLLLSAVVTSLLLRVWDEVVSASMDAWVVGSLSSLPSGPSASRVRPKRRMSLMVVS